MSQREGILCFSAPSEKNLKVLYRIGGADKKVAVSVNVLCDQTYMKLQTSKKKMADSVL